MALTYKMQAQCDDCGIFSDEYWAKELSDIPENWNSYKEELEAFIWHHFCCHRCRVSWLTKHRYKIQ